MRTRTHAAGTVVLLGSLGFGLGCSGLAESVVALSGTEYEMGDDAQMPADFPLPAPPGADKPVSVIRVPIGGKTMRTVSFEVADPMALEPVYAKHFADAGIEFETETSNVLGTSSTTLTSKDGERSVVLSESHGSSSVTLVVTQ